MCCTGVTAYRWYIYCSGIFFLGFRSIEYDFSRLNGYWKVQIPLKPENAYFVSCPNHGFEMEVVVLHGMVFRVFLFQLPRGQDFKPSEALLYSNMGKEPTPGSLPDKYIRQRLKYIRVSWGIEIVHVLRPIGTPFPLPLPQPGSGTNVKWKSRPNTNESRIWSRYFITELQSHSTVRSFWVSQMPFLFTEKRNYFSSHLRRNSRSQEEQTYLKHIVLMLILQYFL